MHHLHTHRPSLGVLVDYVRAEMGVEVVLLGIQPRTVEWGVPLSAEVSQAAQALARLLSDWLGAEVSGDP